MLSLACHDKCNFTKSMTTILLNHIWSIMYNLSLLTERKDAFAIEALQWRFIKRICGMTDLVWDLINHPKCSFPPPLVHNVCNMCHLWSALQLLILAMPTITQKPSTSVTEEEQHSRSWGILPLSFQDVPTNLTEKYIANPSLSMAPYLFVLYCGFWSTVLLAMIRISSGNGGENAMSHFPIQPLQDFQKTIYTVDWGRPISFSFSPNVKG